MNEQIVESLNRNCAKTTNKEKASLFSLGKLFRIIRL